MAFVGLRVPPETARLLSTIDYGDFGDPEPVSAYHITLLNLGEEMPLENVAAALEPLVEVASATRPFTVQTSHVTTFPPHPEHKTVPVICRIDSNEVQDLHMRLRAAFDKAGIPYSKRFKEFCPHVTLAYANDPTVHTDNAVDKHFPVVTWGAHEIVLWGGDNADERIVMTAPLSLGNKGQAAANLKKATFEGFIRIAMLRGHDVEGGPQTLTPPKARAKVVSQQDPLRPKRLSIVEKVLLRYATQKVGTGASIPSDPALWEKALSESRKRFKKPGGAYSDGWALQWYNREGGTWLKR
jgi:2'-5' RNA ligase